MNIFSSVHQKNVCVLGLRWGFWCMQVRYLAICFIEGQEADFDTRIKCCVSPLYEGMNYAGLVCITKFNIM